MAKKRSKSERKGKDDSVSGSKRERLMYEPKPHFPRKDLILARTIKTRGKEVREKVEKEQAILRQIEVEEEKKNINEMMDEGEGGEGEMVDYIDDRSAGADADGGDVFEDAAPQTASNDILDERNKAIVGNKTTVSYL